MTTSEVQQALDTAMLETGVAVITPEMALRDVYRAWRGRREGMSSAALDLPDLPDLPDRATPARALRLRLHLDPISGPTWLTLLGLCAYLRGVLVVQGPQSAAST